MGEGLDRPEVADARAPLQAVRQSEGLLERGGAAGPSVCLPGGEAGANAFELLLVLDLERGEHLRVDVHQSRYLPVTVRSCSLSAVRLATAFSSCAVPTAVCSTACRMSCMPRVTWANPICCCPVAPMICWNACTLSSVVSVISRIVRSVTSACALPDSTRLTASSVSMTELLIPF